MKKTLIASAVAAAAFSGAAMAQESNLPTVYGNIQYALYHTDVEGSSTLDHADNGSTLGIAHEHEIAAGVTGFFKLELEGINANDKAQSNGIDGLDEAYIGVKGDSFGQVWVGSDDSTYERTIDIIANYYEFGAQNLGGGSFDGVYDTGEGDLIQYSSPSFGGLQLHGAVQVNGDSKVGGKSYPYQLAATYAVDAFELAVAMDSNDGALSYSSADELSVNNENTYGVRGTFNLGDLAVTGQYQTRKDVGDLYGVHGSYALGANTFALSYELGEADLSDDEISVLSAQALHNLSDHMYVWVEGYLRTDDSGTAEADTTELAVGAVYYF
ncbi:porin [Marinobacter salinisoli]|uniref:Porin n=1 Tax=Marinobacter salinisoli TaxID=2769486 RepID=A0ABX7MUI3_9GAMM|nr:porin [Marinobacter salinisoli]QSP96045.1 porin [Marinobacter salinisoli]